MVRRDSEFEMCFYAAWADDIVLRFQVHHLIDDCIQSHTNKRYIFVLFFDVCIQSKDASCIDQSAWCHLSRALQKKTPADPNAVGSYYNEENATKIVISWPTRHILVEWRRAFDMSYLLCVLFKRAKCQMSSVLVLSIGVWIRKYICADHMHSYGGGVWPEGDVGSKVCSRLYFPNHRLPFFYSTETPFNGRKCISWGDSWHIVRRKQKSKQWCQRAIGSLIECEKKKQKN